MNSVHYDVGEKGFSFRYDGPLDMRFDRKGDGITAAQIVNRFTPERLREIFYRYGEEKKTPFIVEALVKARQTHPIETTSQLASIIDGASFDPKSKLRVFQALRIETNNEFVQLEESLDQAIRILRTG